MVINLDKYSYNINNNKRERESSLIKCLENEKYISIKNKLLRESVKNSNNKKLVNKYLNDIKFIKKILGGDSRSGRDNGFGNYNYTPTFNINRYVPNSVSRKNNSIIPIASPINQKKTNNIKITKAFPLATQSFPKNNKPMFTLPSNNILSKRKVFIVNFNEDDKIYPDDLTDKLQDYINNQLKPDLVIVCTQNSPQGNNHFQHKLKDGLQGYREVLKCNTTPSFLDRLSNKSCNRVRVYYNSESESNIVYEPYRISEYDKTHNPRYAVTNSSYTLTKHSDYYGSQITYWKYKIQNKRIIVKIVIKCFNPENNESYDFKLMIVNTSYKSKSSLNRSKLLFNNVSDKIYNNDSDEYCVFYCRDDNEIDLGYLKPGVPLICKNSICTHIPIDNPLIDIPIITKSKIPQNKKYIETTSFDLPESTTAISQEEFQRRQKFLLYRYHNINKKQNGPVVTFS